MSLASVRRFLAEHAPDIAIIEGIGSLASVEAASAAIGVPPARIAKTLTLLAGEAPLIVVMSGAARLDAGKFRRRFGAKPRFAEAAAVATLTGHPPGGVTAIGLAAPLPVYCDVSLRAFEQVYPAAGAPDAAFRIAPSELLRLAGGEWIDVSK